MASFGLLFFFFPPTKGLKREQGNFCECSCKWYTCGKVCVLTTVGDPLCQMTQIFGFAFSSFFLFYGNQIWFCFLLYITLPRWVIMVVPIVSVFSKQGNWIQWKFSQLRPFSDVLYPFFWDFNFCVNWVFFDFN